jgi:hypothetical protein
MSLNYVLQILDHSSLELLSGSGCLGANTKNICNSTQKENVNLGWEKHIPNFTENGQK